MRDTLNVLLKFEADIEVAGKQLAGLTAQGAAGCRRAGLMSGMTCAGAPSASEPLRRFLQVARGAGLRVSAAEGIDAARAVDLVGFADRTRAEGHAGPDAGEDAGRKGALRRGFELYFKRDEFAGDDATEPTTPLRARCRPARPSGRAATGWAAAAGSRSGNAAGATTAPRWRPRWNRRRARRGSRTSASSRRRTFMRGASWTAWDCARWNATWRRCARAGTPEGDRPRRLLEGKVEQLRDAVRDFVERNLMLLRQRARPKNSARNC